jgi:hypothetical protein
VDLLFHIGWSTGEDGFTEAWADGLPLTRSNTSTSDPGADARDSVRFKGRNMYYAFTDYLKLGLYRWAAGVGPDLRGGKEYRVLRGGLIAAWVTKIALGLRIGLRSSSHA